MRSKMNMRTTYGQHADKSAQSGCRNMRTGRGSLKGPRPVVRMFRPDILFIAILKIVRMFNAKEFFHDRKAFR